jgi:hypothetical protein
MQAVALDGAAWERTRVVATGVAATAALTLLAATDPARGTLPRCPVHVATGLWCPGCGSQRTLHALVHGDLAGAVATNVLVVLAIPFVLSAYALWAARAFGHPRAPRIAVPARLARALLPTVVLFTVLRNLPAGEPFAP